MHNNKTSIQLFSLLLHHLNDRSHHILFIFSVLQYLWDYQKAFAEEEDLKVIFNGIFREGKKELKCPLLVIKNKRFETL